MHTGVMGMLIFFKKHIIEYAPCFLSFFPIHCSRAQGKIIKYLGKGQAKFVKT